MNLRNLRNLGCISLSLLLSTHGIRAQDFPANEHLKRAADHLKAMFEQFREEQLTRFSDEFFRAVPKQRLIDGLKANGAALGPIQRTRLVRLSGPWTGDFEFIARDGKRLRARILLDPQPPHRIVNLIVGKIDRGQDTWDQLKQSLDQFPGKKSVTVMSGSAGENPVFEYEADTPLAVGSSFKLFVLSALVQQIEQKRRAWDEVTRLRSEWRSLPSGILQDWPAGSPITAHTLATLMISRSDNTAADHLMHWLGRETLENELVNLGVSQPARNRPFLRTAELFKLKLVQPEDELRRFASASEPQRRVLLDKLQHVALLSPRQPSKPLLIDQVEWFFSTRDLCRLMHFLVHSPQQEKVLPILALTRPFDIDDFAWDYLAFKGGAEVGVFNLSVLGRLKGKTEWRYLSLTWNRTDAPLDEEAWIRLAERAARLLEQGKK